MRILQYSDRGPSVQLLQLALFRAGNTGLELDGVFGQETLNALRRFQASKGLQPTGVYDEATAVVLRPYLTGVALHTVVRGDTLWKLAKRYTTTVAAIETANPGVDSQNLQIGSVLKVPLHFDVVPTNVKYTSELVEAIAEGLTARYPFIEAGSIGESEMGRQLRSFRLGAGSVSVAYNASHHANEWITTPVLLKFLEQYARAYAMGGTVFGRLAETLFNEVTLYIVPLVNPDGVDLVNGAIADGEWYRGARQIAANYPSIAFPSGWKANILGTDLNVNYPALWDEAKRIKYALGYVSPAPRDFVGDYPLSASESRAMYAFTQAHDFRLILAYHSQGEVIFWKFQDYDPPNSYEIAVEFERVSGYAAELTPTASGYAGYKDWFIQEYNLPGYTIEVGRGSNPLPLSLFDDIYQDNIGILVLGMELSLPGAI
ncbi:MAG: M14 family metallopeptidase [Clostridia bacterium]|nr:M14 family metallopeptidase [Clostridia bacterium]